MITLPSGNLLVETVAELPDLRNADELFMDFETRSGDPKRGGTRPYHGDRICGIAVTADAHRPAWYIPVRHNGISAHGNLAVPAVQAWLCDTLRTAADWVNHNVKFDAHFAAVDGAEFGGRLVDTLTLAKIHYSDSMTYGLKALCRNWVGLEMAESGRLQAYLKGARTKDFADAPPDILGDYACEDVQSNRKLYDFLKRNCDDDIRGVWETEIRLTPVLFDMERTGMPVNDLELKIEKIRTLQRLIDMSTELRDLTGREINPRSSPQVYDLFVNQMGLPIIAYSVKKDRSTGKYISGNATFDKHAMKKYLAHPEVLSDAKKRRTVELLSAYREEAQYRSLFLETYADLAIDGILHPTYNQAIRTGRMSCSAPNAQQLSKRAKRLIHPGKGEGILSFDYSQIEYRLIVHYIQDTNAIRAYAENPETDFHQFVADECGISRKQAKNLNFAIGYGAGKAKVLSMLATDPTLIESVASRVLGDGGSEAASVAFNREVQSLTLRIYNSYHARLPSLKLTSNHATATAKTRGFIFNAYGRRRHLPAALAYRAFNSIIQPCAADVMKERLCAVAPRYNVRIRESGLRVMINVHDETVFRGPCESCRDPELQRYIKDTLEDTTVKFRVPIVTNGGYSERDWNEASGDKATTYEDSIGGPIEWETDSVADVDEMNGVGFA